MRTFLAIGGILMSVLSTAEAAKPRGDWEKNAKAFVSAHEKIVRPLEIQVGLAWWTANVSGKDEDFAAKEKAQNALDKALSDTRRFAELKGLYEKRPGSGALGRQIELLHLQYLEKQVAPDLLAKMSELSNRVEKAFNVYRAEVDGRAVTDSEIRKVLKESKDSGAREAHWKASKGVGRAVLADLKELVKVRNEAARKLGFPHYHDLALFLTEHRGSSVMQLFDDLDKLTRQPFEKAKARMDERLAKEFKIQPAELRPWHYGDLFFQQAPAQPGADLDEPYRKADILALCEKFYGGIDLPLGEILKRSDLYEKKGKTPHAFCTDIDREGDVRVLANIVPTEYWMSTMLHELGHAVYSSQFIPRELPYVLRGEAHILTTEGFAMIFQRLSKTGAWLKSMGVEAAKGFDEAGRAAIRDELLVFSRWCQVMLRFERALYENPEQNLNKLWWDLVEKYQGLKRPEGRDEPDFAAKIHIVSAPAYYHNYMMGELFASQVLHAMKRDLKLPSTLDLAGRKEVGAWIKKHIFAPGRTLAWNEMTKQATGEMLNPKAFAADFAD